MTRSLRLSFVLALVAIPFAAAAFAHRTPDGAAPAAESQAEGKLEEVMQGLQAGHQRLGKALDKKDVPAALGLVAEMQTSAHAAKHEVPGRAAEIKDEPAKAAFLLGYKKQIIELERVLLDIENALLDNKPEDAKKLSDEKLKALKKTGHDKYKG
jgi:hypothetical protein